MALVGAVTAGLAAAPVMAQPAFQTSPAAKRALAAERSFARQGTETTQDSALVGLPLIFIILAAAAVVVVGVVVVSDDDSPDSP